MNRLFVAYKPIFISSNHFLQRIKRRYRVKKAGFSGTLDPFACGTLIIAFGAYTKLFPYLAKYPKTYVATLWLGARSPSLDIERIESITEVPKLPIQKIRQTLSNLQGQITYTPPKFSAKKIGGKRAYTMVDEDITLPQVTSIIYSIRLLRYAHPFVTFEATASEGTYIRSLGAIIAERLGTQGALSYLERTREGRFVYENERPLDPLDYLISRPNSTSLDAEAIKHGKKLRLQDLAIQEDGLYHLVFDAFFTIIEIKDGTVHYRLNNIPRMHHAC